MLYSSTSNRVLVALNENSEKLEEIISTVEDRNLVPVIINNYAHYNVHIMSKKNNESFCCVFLDSKLPRDCKGNNPDIPYGANFADSLIEMSEGEIPILFYSEENELSKYLSTRSKRITIMDEKESLPIKISESFLDFYHET